jgi:hypothetical protein
MLVKKSITAFLLFFISVVLGLGLVYRLSPGASWPLSDKNDPYAALWKRVDSCERKGLTESALKVVEGIYTRSKAESNAPQLVKAVIYKMKYAQYKEEFSQEKNINQLLAEARQAQFPVKPVLESLVAESFWQYYQANRWKFYDRSQTVAFNKEDIATYDLKSLVSEVIFHYRASLADTNRLKATKIDLFEEIVTSGTKPARLWRPTLYDFLAHRALDFYKNSEAEVTKAANQFALNDAAYLEPYPEFLKFNPASPADSLDLKYYAVILFRDLLNFHGKTNNDDALMDLEMERLHFMKEASQHPNKDSLYLNSLSWLEKRFDKNARVAELYHLEAQWWQEKAALYNPLANEDHKWDRKKAVEICNSILKKYQGSRGAQLAKNTLSEIQARTLTVTAEETNDVDQPNRVLVNYTNVPKVYFRLVKADYLDYLKLQNKYYDKEAVSKLLHWPTVTDFAQELPDDKDYNNHSVEVKIPAAGVGYYVLLASSSPQFLAKESSLCYQLYAVSGMAYLSKRRMGGGYDLYVLDRQNGQPLKEVKAQVWYHIYNYASGSYEFQKAASYTSSEQGFFGIEPVPGNSNSFMIELTNGKDKLFSKTEFFTYSEHEYKVPETRSFIFTDRAIYRPGQTVYFKSILLRGLKNKHEIVPGQAMTLTFYDVNHQKIASQDLVTNEYGTVSGSFTAPQSGLTGQMSITDNYGTAYISVEEYKRPKFETSFDTLRGSYRLNDEVSLKGFARAYAGNVVDGAEVKYRVLRRVDYPYWWYWYRPYHRPASEVEITNGVSKTNEKGEFEIRFKALPDAAVSKTDNPTYTYEISADVTDMNGETRSAQADFRVGYKALELSFSCPEVINLMDLPKMTVSALNLNGVEEKASGQLTVFELNQPDKVFRRRLWAQPDKQVYSQQEYYKLFPNDLFEDESNRYKWGKKRQAFTRSFDTEKDRNVLMNEFKNLVPGVYLVEGVCKDKYGEEVKSVNYVTVYNPSSSELPFKTALWSHAIKTNAEPGEKASFIAASSYSNVTCLYELEGEERHEHSFITPSMKSQETIVKESDRGGLQASAYFVKFGRVYSASHYITVPFSNKDLVIEYASFRNKLLPGQKEEWKLTVKNKKGDKAVAEMLATLYDASLDAYRPNQWNFGLYSTFYPRFQWTHSLERESQPYQYNDYASHYVPVEEISYDELNYFGLSFYRYGRGYGNGPVKKYKSRRGARGEEKAEAEMEMFAMDATAAAPAVANMKEQSKGTDDGKDKRLESVVAGGTPAQKTDKQEAPMAPRKNFNETAFFFPQLQTNEKGEVLIQFTIPESLTKWKFMGLAHTKDLSYGQTQNEVVTQKELMVTPNAPRFFREGDQMTFAAKLSNLSDKDLAGTAEIHFFDAFTEQDITARLLETKEGIKPVTIKKSQSALAEWNISIPEGLQAIKYKVVARAGNHSDGEEMAVPVLTNRMLVTESLPLPVRGNQSKEFVFSKFINQNNNSSTLRNHAYTLEFTANPAWYAIQSLPYLMEYPYECAEQVFARYYSNALASHVVNSKPKIKQVFEAWKSNSSESFLSNLEKNQELKALVLEETPWVLQAKSESENKKRVALLFDLNKMGNELEGAMSKLAKMQTSNGAWPWFSGCPEDWYITQHIAAGFGHLRKLGVSGIEEGSRGYEMAKNALPFCDRKVKAEYDWLRQHDKNYLKGNHLSYMAIHYLYMRSYFKEVPIGKEFQEAFMYYKRQAQKYWLDNSRYMQGMLALALSRYDDKTTAMDILRSLKENSLNSEEMGMYWKENYGGYYWYQAPIEMQALMVEAFDEVGQDEKAVDDLKTWLIKSKQTQHWGTTRATTEAVYALLLRGTDWLATEPNVEISLGAVKLNPKTDPQIRAEAGTGYFKKTFTGSDIQPAMGKIKVVKKDAGVSWGAVYWQYFEQLDKITPHETPLKLTRRLFLQTNTASGPVITPITESSRLKPGDKIKVRIELRADRDMEYVHLKDMRAAGFEPLNVFSGYRYQDGLGYYESTRDAATNFFISYLPKGTYVFEYPVVVSHYGDFSNGISSIQCMYAPEFTSHSAGIRVSVRK